MGQQTTNQEPGQDNTPHTQAVASFQHYCIESARFEGPRAGEARLRARALEKLIARALVRRAFIEHGLSAPREVERLIVQLANSEQ